MPHRTVLSLVRGLFAAAASLAPLFVAPATHAAESEAFPTISFLMQAPAISTGVRPEDALVAHEIPLLPEFSRTIDLTAQPEDLWDRVRNGFAMTDLNDNLVLHYQQWYQNRPDALRRMVERSRPFLHHIVEELEARGMPTELALLPMVESSFNPMAYSRAHAAGLWQFIPATGKRFKLEQNWWQDERRDIIASTSAALDYLQTIYDMHGDWHLALASYNWGEGAVKRAIEKNEARGLPTDYVSLNMPQETRHYVPKLQALKNIFGNPLLVGRLGLPRIANRPYFATLEAPRPLDMKTAARLANISLDEFQRLNPSHNRPLIKPSTPVVVPAEKMDAFQENLRNHGAPLSEWRGYTLKSIDRLSNIADQFGIPASELARINGLPERVRLGVGTTLLVPGSGETDNLAPLLNASAPTQIIEPEPRAPVCGRKQGRHCTPAQVSPTPPKMARGDAAAKPSKTKFANVRQEDKPARGQAIAVTQRNGDKNSVKKTQVTSVPVKSATPKVAKASQGRRG